MFRFGIPPAIGYPVVALFVVLWIWMIVESLRSKENSVLRLAWFAFVLCTGPVGALVYLLICYLPRRARNSDRATESPNDPSQRRQP